MNLSQTCSALIAAIKSGKSAPEVVETFFDRIASWARPRETLAILRKLGRNYLWASEVDSIKEKDKALDAFLIEIAKVCGTL